MSNFFEVDSTGCLTVTCLKGLHELVALYAPCLLTKAFTDDVSSLQVISKCTDETATFLLCSASVDSVVWQTCVRPLLYAQQQLAMYLISHAGTTNEELMVIQNLIVTIGPADVTSSSSTTTTLFPPSLLKKLLNGEKGRQALALCYGLGECYLLQESAVKSLLSALNVVISQQQQQQQQRQKNKKKRKNSSTSNSTSDGTTNLVLVIIQTLADVIFSEWPVAMFQAVFELFQFSVASTETAVATAAAAALSAMLKDGDGSCFNYLSIILHTSSSSAKQSSSASVTTQTTTPVDVDTVWLLEQEFGELDFLAPLIGRLREIEGPPVKDNETDNMADLKWCVAVYSFRQQQQQQKQQQQVGAAAILVELFVTDPQRFCAPVVRVGLVDFLAAAAAAARPGRHHNLLLDVAASAATLSLDTPRRRSLHQAITAAMTSMETLIQLPVIQLRDHGTEHFSNQLLPRIAVNSRRRTLLESLPPTKKLTVEQRRFLVILLNHPFALVDMPDATDDVIDAMEAANCSSSNAMDVSNCLCKACTFLAVVTDNFVRTCPGTSKEQASQLLQWVVGKPHIDNVDDSTTTTTDSTTTGNPSSIDPLNALSNDVSGPSMQAMSKSAESLDDSNSFQESLDDSNSFQELPRQQNNLHRINRIWWPTFEALVQTINLSSVARGTIHRLVGTFSSTSFDEQALIEAFRFQLCTDGVCGVARRIVAAAGYSDRTDCKACSNSTSTRASSSSLLAIPFVDIHSALCTEIEEACSESSDNALHRSSVTIVVPDQEAILSYTGPQTLLSRNNSLHSLWDCVLQDDSCPITIKKSLVSTPIVLPETALIEDVVSSRFLSLGHGNCCLLSQRLALVMAHTDAQLQCSFPQNGGQHNLGKQDKHNEDEENLVKDKECVDENGVPQNPWPWIGVEEPSTTSITPEPAKHGFQNPQGHNFCYAHAFTEAVFAFPLFRQILIEFGSIVNLAVKKNAEVSTSASVSKRRRRSVGAGMRGVTKHHELVRKFALVLKSLSSGKGLQGNMLAFRTALFRMPHTEFKEGELEDVSQFMTHLLDAFDDCSVRSEKDDNDYNAVAAIDWCIGFWGRKRLQCPGNHTRDCRLEKFHKLDLPCDIDTSVQAALDRYFEWESSDADTRCDDCTRLGGRQRNFICSRPPPILIVCLKRFDYVSGPKKISNAIDCFSADHLVLPLSISQQSSRHQYAYYRLDAIVEHQGETADAGHYTAFVRQGVTDKWVHFDDKKVMEGLSTDSVQAAVLNSAYLLFYTLQQTMKSNIK